MTRNHSQTRRVFVGMYWWEDRIFEGIARYASEHNWLLDCRMRWTHALPDLSHWDGDGVIANVGVTNPHQPLIKFIRRIHVPVIGMQPTGDYPCAARVIVSHEEVGKVAAEHFIKLGFANLAFVTFAENPIERRRCDMFAATARAAHLNFFEIPFKSFKERIKKLPAPLGLAAANDINAMHVMHACLDCGRRVPEEIAILGVDDTELLCKFTPVPMSSVNCNFERQGYEAATLLDSLMRGAKPPKTPIMIPVKGVTVRHSTDILPISNLKVALAISFLRSRFNTPVQMSEVATHVGTPLRQLQKDFVLHTHTSMLRELTRFRVEHAKKLLCLPTKMKMESIAHECGFSNRIHFVRAFTRTEKKSPKSFRTTAMAK